MSVYTQTNLDWRSLLRSCLMCYRLGIGQSVVDASNRPARVLGANQKTAGPLTVVSCAFTGTDGTLLSAYLWADPTDVRPGAYQWYNIFSGFGVHKIISNKAVNQGAGLYDSALYFGNSDYTITADVTTGKTSSTIDIQGIHFRVIDANNFWFLRRSKTPQQIDLFESTTLRASAAYPYTEQESYTIKIVLSGTNISCLVGAVPLTYSSSSFQSASIASIYTRITATVTTFPTVDNFKVTVP